MRENETNTEKTLMEENQCLKHEFDVTTEKERYKSSNGRRFMMKKVVLFLVAL